MAQAQCSTIRWRLLKDRRPDRDGRRSPGSERIRASLVQLATGSLAGLRTRSFAYGQKTCKPRPSTKGMGRSLRHSVREIDFRQHCRGISAFFSCHHCAETFSELGRDNSAPCGRRLHLIRTLGERCGLTRVIEAANCSCFVQL